MTQPVLLLGFANDPKNPGKYLPQLIVEQRELKALLRESDDHACESVFPLPDPQDLLRELQHCQDRMLLFHFSGHANAEFLDLEALAAQETVRLHGENLLYFLAQAPNLKLVFLNACKTFGHVEKLKAAGIPAIIATNQKVPDQQAKDFALSFYKALLAQQSLQAAFEQARIQLAPGDPHDRIFRGFERLLEMGKKPDRDSTGFPWGLYLNEEEVLAWKLPQKEPKYLTPPPPKPPAQFLGREAELTDTFNRLHSHSSLILLNGMGGIGKTALALAYAEQYKGHYDHVAWVNCPSGLLPGIFDGNLEKGLGLELDTELDESQRLARLTHTMANRTGKHLLVLDNVNQAEDLNTYYTKLNLPHWQILITSRAQPEGIPETYQKQLSVLRPEQALELFLQHYPPAQDQEELVARLLYAIEGHTLTIELLAKSLAKQKSDRYGLAELVADLEQQGVLKLPKNRPVISDYRTGKYKPEALLSSMFDISGLVEDPLTHELLRQWCLFPPSFHDFEQLESLVLPGLSAESDWEEALEHLVEAGWVEQAPSKALYKLHPLIREVMQQQLNPKVDEIRTLPLTLKTKLQVERLSEVSPYLPIAQYVFDKLDEINILIGDLGIDLIDVYLKLGRIQEALLIAEQTLSYLQADQDTYKTARVLERIGTIYQAKGNFVYAMKFFIDEVALFKELQKNKPNLLINQIGLANSYSKLGLIYQAKGEMEAALKYLKKYNSIIEELYHSKPNDNIRKTDLAISYGILGEHYFRIYNYKKSKIFIYKANTILEGLFKENSNNYKLNLAISYTKLAELYQSQGKFEEALTYFQKSNALYKTLFTGNPESESLKKGLAISYSRLGEIYQRLGHLYHDTEKYNSALLFHKKHSRLSKELFNKNPYSESIKLGLAVSYSKLGEYYESIKNYKKAKYFYLKDLKLAKELYQDNLSNINLYYGLGVSYFNIGTIHKYIGEAKEFKACYEKAATIFKNLYKKTYVESYQDKYEHLSEELMKLSSS